MNRRQIEARVQRTQFRWVLARLDGYVLQFNKRRKVDQSGKANIVPDGSGRRNWLALEQQGNRPF